MSHFWCNHMIYHLNKDTLTVKGGTINNYTRTTSISQDYWGCTVALSILQMRKLKYKKVKQTSQGHSY